MGLQIKKIDSSEFDLMKEEWNGLLQRSASDSVFLRWEWIHTWWNVFQKDKRLFILTARQDGRLCGIAPFYVDQTGGMRRRILKFCSEELSPDYMDMILESGREGEVVQDMIHDILQRRNEWDVMDLDNLRAESALLSHPSLFHDYFSTSCVSHRCPFIKVEGTFEDYQQPRTRLASFRFKKKMKSLLENKGVTHRIASDVDRLSKELDDLFLLHEKRSNSKNMQSNFMTETVRQFHQELAPLFFQEQILSLHLLYHRQTPLSAIYAFNYKNKTFYYQTGFDPEWSKLSVGAVLLYSCIRRAFADGLREFDFLKGEEGYKSLWANASRNEMRFTVYNSNWRGLFWGVLKRCELLLRNANHSLVDKTAEMPTQTQ